MKFGKTYSEYIEKEAANQLAGCSYVEFKRLKKLLKNCPIVHESSSSGDDADSPSTSSCNSSCSGVTGVSCCSTTKKVREGPPKKVRERSPVAFTGGECPSSCPGTAQSILNPSNYRYCYNDEPLLAFVLDWNWKAVVCRVRCQVLRRLMEELSEVVGCFNSRAEQLVKLHMATGLKKYILRRKRNHSEAMIQEGQILINYASMNAIAVRKILKKYDKVLIYPHPCA